MLKGCRFAPAAVYLPTRLQDRRGRARGLALAVGIARRAAEEMQQSYRQVGLLEEELKSAGAWVFGGRLHEPDTATVVRMSDGEVLTIDGPFAESKEHLGGFYILEAEDLDAALAWASKVTAVVKVPIEVRPFADYPQA